MATPDPDCVFCAIIARDTPAFEVLRDDVAVAFLDISPLFVGHTLVVPLDHHVTLPDLPADVVEPFFSRVRELSRAIPEALGAQGTFVAMNNIVSQSVPHLHAHVAPRTKGDGLRGFFWPRTTYDSDAHAAETAATIAAAVDADQFS